MRTSNKILLGLLLTAILLFAGLFLSVRLIFANGNMVERKDANVDPWSDEYKIKEEIKSVSISGQMDMTIIPSDSAKIVISKMGDSLVRYRVKDGVLLIDLDTSKIHPDQNGQITVIHNHVELYLPNVDSIHVAKSTIILKKLTEPAQTKPVQIKPVYNIELDNTTLTIEHDYRFPDTTFYDVIRVNAGPASTVRFYGPLSVGSAAIKLKGAFFEDRQAHFDKLSIQADSSSSINIKGHSLRKATITTTE
jgi:hypothetical protein